MFQHFIIVASSYTEGKRVGFHMTAPEGKLDNDEIRSILDRLKEIKRDDVGIHSFTSDDSTWESVLKFDSFFEDVMICEDFEEFEEIVKSDLKLSAIDIAKFFLAIQATSHLKLQKLIYLAYKKYLLKYEERLFPEKIVAYDYGPVVQEVYQKFKKYGADTIETDSAQKYILKDIHLSQALGRMLLVKEFEKVVPILLETFEEYGDLTASELVGLTHSKNGPWHSVYKRYQNCEITDEIIISHAKYER